METSQKLHVCMGPSDTAKEILLCDLVLAVSELFLRWTHLAIIFSNVLTRATTLHVAIKIICQLPRQFSFINTSSNDNSLLF